MNSVFLLYVSLLTIFPHPPVSGIPIYDSDNRYQELEEIGVSQDKGSLSIETNDYEDERIGDASNRASDYVPLYKLLSQQWAKVPPEISLERRQESVPGPIYYFPNDDDSDESDETTVSESAPDDDVNNQSNAGKEDTETYYGRHRNSDMMAIPVQLQEFFHPQYFPNADDDLNNQQVRDYERKIEELREKAFQTNEIGNLEFFKESERMKRDLNRMLGLKDNTHDVSGSGNAKHIMNGYLQNVVLNAECRGRGKKRPDSDNSGENSQGSNGDNNGAEGSSGAGSGADNGDGAAEDATTDENLRLSNNNKSNNRHRHGKHLE